MLHRNCTVCKLAGFLYIAAAEERAAKVIKSAKEPVYLQPFKDTMTEFFQKGIVQEGYFSYNKWTMHMRFLYLSHAVKPVKNSHSKIDKTKILLTNGSLMKVKVLQNAPFVAFCNTFDLH